MIIFTLVSFAIIIVLFCQNRTQEIQQENEFLQSYLLSLETFYRGIKKEFEEMRKYRHDLAKHIQTLEYLSSIDSQSPEIHNYLDTLKKKSFVENSIIYSPDEVVNMILSIKQRICSEHHISFYIQTDQKAYPEIEGIDMVSLLHNLIDNAIEANLRIENINNRNIWFSISREQDNINIHIINCIRHGEHVIFHTRKANSFEHGIGTVIIQNIIAKYNGIRKCQEISNSDIFCDDIILKIRKRETI